MPKSKVRRKPTYTPPAAAAAAASRGPGPSPRWLAPLMIALFLLGVAWLVVYYITEGSIPVMEDLGAWNIGVGFALMSVAFGLATRWR